MPEKKSISLLTVFIAIIMLGVYLSAFTDKVQAEEAWGSINYEAYQALVPTCLDRSSIPDEEYHWLHIPADPGELATREYYGFLAGQLISSGVIDAADCPLGGTWPSGYANACGLDRAKETVFLLQNMYDDEILQAARDVGTPPVMLKQLLRYESQFWPKQYGFYHHGLSHVTLIGASAALQWNPALYNEVCQEYYKGPCPGVYLSSVQYFDNNLSNQLVSMLDSSCEDCEYGIDVQKAEESINLISQVLMGYCRQASQIVYNVSGKHSSYVVDYATIWKLTLINYNAGPGCVYAALDNAYDGEDDFLTWSEISNNVEGDGCLRGLKYAEGITEPYFTFTPED